MFCKNVKKSKGVHIVSEENEKDIEQEQLLEQAESRAINQKTWASLLEGENASDISCGWLCGCFNECSYWS